MHGLTDKRSKYKDVTCLDICNRAVDMAMHDTACLTAVCHVQSMDPACLAVYLD